MKKTILHFIYNLGRGGAEMMMVKVIRELRDYNNIVVTLTPENHFGDELKCDKYFCLNLKSILFFPQAALQLNRIIRDNKVDLVHSHLFWPTVVARMGTPRNVPLVTTIHAFIATSVEYRNFHIRLLDKLTYRLRKSAIIAVAKGALNEYFTFLKLKPYKAYSLYTFVDGNEFNESFGLARKRNQNGIRLVTVGALRLQKNHEYLLKAFKLLRTLDITLDIYGTGPLKADLQKVITDEKLKINLKGEVRNINQILSSYDLFIMSSTFEGFSLSVLEAMAMNVPLLLSDIKSFHEQCEDTAAYFDLNDEQDFVLKLNHLLSNKAILKSKAERAKIRVAENFTLIKHMQGLRKIYSELIPREVFISLPGYHSTESFSDSANYSR